MVVGIKLKLRENTDAQAHLDNDTLPEGTHWAHLHTQMRQNSVTRGWKSSFWSEGTPLGVKPEEDEKK